MARRREDTHGHLLNGWDRHLTLTGVKAVEDLRTRGPSSRLWEGMTSWTTRPGTGAPTTASVVPAARPRGLSSMSSGGVGPQ